MDDTNKYLARVSRDLRASRADEELRIEPIAVIAAGRRRVRVDVATSDRHGAAVRMTLREPPPATPGGYHRDTFVFVTAPEVDQLIAALTEARARLGTHK